MWVANTITVRVHGRELVSNTYTVTVTRIANDDASLSALSLSDDIKLSPEFAAGTMSYTASVPNDTRCNKRRPISRATISVARLRLIAGASVEADHAG